MVEGRLCVALTASKSKPVSIPLVLLHVVPHTRATRFGLRRVGYGVGYGPKPLPRRLQHHAFLRAAALSQRNGAFGLSLGLIWGRILMRASGQTIPALVLLLSGFIKSGALGRTGARVHLRLCQGLARSAFVLPLGRLPLLNGGEPVDNKVLRYGAGAGLHVSEGIQGHVERRVAVGKVHWGDVCWPGWHRPS